ncbi:YihY/virulence factor BrkB family protein [Dactylosporangium aurantiacum]|uniref:YihY/virulence factor BrkB family protein n=1 Tax=Dactylosporangium aurantiacum TaxID=35754 RepID=A0A9Q9IRS3_9ACTN|nr:YihY/virulence factor BrkB family protein [Dactylosporangium aurantiacum]MDG6106307.1 YihY/virulence factor BrkB family protein [Dactylosporangium aurantiacum]UWZ58200.1 YihY/virulence factor BrkB family protein [Dactylosporangium aurantiacum]
MDRYQRQHAWLGFPLAVVYKFFDDRGPYLASMVTYYGFISLFPLTLLFFTALGFFLEANPDLQQQLVQSAVGDLPAIGPELQRNVSELRGSGTRLVLSVIGALYGGLGAMQAAQAGFNHIYGIPRNEQPNPVRSRLRSLGLLVMLGGAVLLSAAATAFVTFAHQLTGRSGPGLQLLGYLLTFAVNAALFTAAMQLLTARTLLLRQVIAGGLIGASFWMVLQTAGARYVATRLGHASALYGTFGLVLTALAWIYLQALVLMLCAELNMIANFRLWPRALLAPFTDDVDLTDADRRIYTALAAAQRFKGFQTVRVDFDRRDEP